jgi:hypothetical protein
VTPQHAEALLTPHVSGMFNIKLSHIFMTNPETKCNQDVNATSKPLHHRTMTVTVTVNVIMIMIMIMDTEGFGTPLGSPAGIDTLVDAADNNDLEME